MNPLSPFTYYRRHKRRALLLTALLALAVMGLYLLVGLFKESYVTPEYTINRYLSKFSLVQTDPLDRLDPAVADQIRAHPDVAQALPQNNVEITVPNVGGLGFYFRLFGLQEADMATVLARSGVSLLVFARPGREAAVDDFLRQSIRSSRTDVYTHKLLEEAVARSQASLYALLAPIMLLVTAAVTLVVGAINQLAFMRRLPEFGTLHAVGRSKGWLARRLTLETAGLALAGWALGLLASWGGMAVLSAALYAPQGFPFQPLQGMALLLVTPVPLAVIGFTLFTALRALGRLDAVAIVERGELSLEEERSGEGARPSTGGLPRPLASTTFYRRHKSTPTPPRCPPNWWFRASLPGLRTRPRTSG